MMLGSDNESGAGSLARWVGVLVSQALLVIGICSRGPAHFVAPATVFSNSALPQRLAEPFLLFLAHVRGVLPEGSSVAVVPDDPDPDALLPYLTALSQLPKQQVLTPSSLSPPEFVAVFRGTLHKPGYRLLRLVPGGAVYQRP